MDAILFWNEVALDANRDSHTTGQDAGVLGPPLSARALAIVHLAMYEAFAGASGNPADLPPYLTSTTSPPAPVRPLVGQAMPEAAVAAAARRTLLCLHPSLAKEINKKYQSFVSSLTGPSVPRGLAFGELVADLILSDRGDDPDVSEIDGKTGAVYVAPLTHGTHRKDPDNPTQPYHAPFYGKNAKCFSVASRHSLDAPPLADPSSTEYMDALNEVRGKGIAPELMGTLPASVTKRTVDETLKGIFWGYDGAMKLGTPPRLYNQIVRIVAAKQGNTQAKNARLFALVNVAMADAGILAWADKYKYNYWRPVVAIREHDASMGPQGVASNNISNACDTGWLPLGGPKTNEPGKKNFTPPFPAYPSGHATFGAAALHITRLFYGDAGPNTDQLFKDLSLVSEEFDGVNVDNKGTVRPRHVRNFQDGLWQMMIENSRSRVFLGVHWVFDGFATTGSSETPDLNRFVGGVPLGMRIAEDIFNKGANLGLKKSNV
ncbi:MAG: hypothetical protein WCR52_17285 [Bacteroidota bacterium]